MKNKVDKNLACQNAFHLADKDAGIFLSLPDRN